MPCSSTRWPREPRGPEGKESPVSDSVGTHGRSRSEFARMTSRRNSEMRGVGLRQTSSFVRRSGGSGVLRGGKCSTRGGALKQTIACATFRRRSGATACGLVLIATAAAVSPAIAQTTEQFTVARVVKYAPGTDKVRARLSALPAASAVVAGDFAVAVEDLDDDGRQEIVLRPRDPKCRQSLCTLLVLKLTPNGIETLFNRLVPPSELAVTNEKVGGFRALAAIDHTGQILTGASTGGQQVYAMRDATPPPAIAADTGAANSPAATPFRGGLVGRSIGDRDGIDEAFLRAVDCNGSANVRHEGSLRGRPFQLIAASCLFEGGNAQWSTLLVAFHHGQQITQAIAFVGSLNVDSFIGPKNDRIVYEAMVTRPEDARCCPSGRAIVEIDVDRQRATARAVGFAKRYDPVPGKTLK